MQELIEKRTRNSKTHFLGKSPDGRDKFSWDGVIGAIHYRDNPKDEAESWKEIDNFFEPALAPWDWQMLRAGYHIRVKEDFTAGQIIEFEKQSETVQFQPMALEWTNDLDQIQPIGMPQGVVPVITNPEVDLLPAIGMPSHQGTIRWNDAYSEGIDFEWRCTSTRLIKILEIENLNKLPIPEQFILDGGNPVLRLNLIFDPSSGVDIYVDGELWDKKTKKQTINVIEFRKDGEVLWGFIPLRYWGSGIDLETNEGQSVATLEKRGNKLYISIKVPYDWLQSAVYPVFIDTNVDEQVGASTDDVEQTPGGVIKPAGYSVDLHDIDDYAGLRWTSVNVASGTTIDVAYIQINLDDDSDDYFDGKTVYCENKSNPPTFGGMPYDVSNRTFTSNSVALGTGAQGTGWKTSPSIVTLVQEVVDDQGGSGDAFVVIIKSTTGDDLDIATWDQDPILAAKLHIEYTAGAAAYIPRHSGTAGIIII